MIKLTEARPGQWWLYCEEERVNLAMRSPTKEDAMIEAIGYYQKRLAALKTRISELEAKQAAILDLVIPEDEVLVSRSDRDWLDSYR